MNLVFNNILKSLIVLGSSRGVILLEYGEVSLEFSGIGGNGGDLAEFLHLKVYNKLLILVAKDLDDSCFKSVLSIK